MSGNDLPNICVWRGSSLWVYFTVANLAGYARLQVPDCCYYFLGLFLKVEKWGNGSPLPWTKNRYAY